MHRRQLARKGDRVAEFSHREAGAQREQLSFARLPQRVPAACDDGLAHVVCRHVLILIGVVGRKLLDDVQTGRAMAA
eukprot:4680924-Prymnesium_polylepis.1